MVTLSGCGGQALSAPTAELIGSTPPLDFSRQGHTVLAVSALPGFAYPGETVLDAAFKDGDADPRAKCPEAARGSVVRTTPSDGGEPVALFGELQLDARCDPAGGETAFEGLARIQAYNLPRRSWWWPGAGEAVLDDFRERRWVNLDGREVPFQERLRGTVRGAVVLGDRDLGSAPKLEEVRELAALLQGLAHQPLARQEYRVDLRWDRGSDEIPERDDEWRSRAWDYTFTRTDLGTDEKVLRERWDGFGTVADAKLGTWTFQIEGLTFDSSLPRHDAPEAACFEPVEGVVTLESGGHTARLEVDGRSNCTRPGCVPWTLDGVRQPQELCGLSHPASCSVGGPATTLSWLLLLLVAAPAFRRRSKAAATGPERPARARPLG